MENYKKKFNINIKSEFTESIFTSKYDKELYELAKKYEEEVEKNGGTNEDAITSMCITIGKACLGHPRQTSANFSGVIKVIINMLKSALKEVTSDWKKIKND